MNHKRSRNSKQSLSPWKNGKLTSASRSSDRESNTPQITSLDQPLWFWRRHSGWSYFNRGLFWGGLVSLTSIFSALGGVALTSIDAIEQQISNRLGESGGKVAVESQTIDTPLQILLVEVKPDRDALVGFSEVSSGKSKNILLVKIEPENNFVRGVNVPGNSRVQIPGFGEGTVSDAFQMGGIKLLAQSLNQSSTEIEIDRYLATSPEVFKQLTDSGKINLPNCDPRIKNCQNLADLITRQETAFETIRQRLNIPGYFTSFKTAIAKAEPQLNTDISMPELLSMVNFIKELEPNRLTVDLLPDYTPARGRSGSSLALSLEKPEKLKSNFDSNLTQDSSLQSRSVAVQNTTDDPELGRRVVAYLRSRNFGDVYLVRHIPLKLEQTRIVTNYGQVETANYLKNILGFGNLEAKSSQQQELVLQLGEDALYLPQS